MTLDAGTGAQKWGQLLASPEACGDLASFATTYTGAPHVFESGGTTQVVAGYGAVFEPGPPLHEPDTLWQSTSFDAATGEQSDTPGGYVVAMRGADQARSGLSYALVQLPPFPVPVVQWTQRVSLGAPGPLGRSFVVARSTSATSLGPAKLTLSQDLVFHSGSGSLVTEPEMPVATGNGVRAYPRDEARPGCGQLECPVWATQTDGAPTTPVVGQDGDVLYARTSQTLYALDSATGDELWTGDVGSGAAPAVAEGLIYLPTDDGRVLVFDAGGCGEATCEPTWEVDTGSGEQVSTPTIAGDVLYAASGGSVYAFSASGCDQAICNSSTSLWSGTGDTQPVVSFGQLYTTTDGAVVAYGLD